MANIRKTLPENEMVWVMNTLDNGTIYYITSDRSRMSYHLWRQVDGGYKYICQHTSPTVLTKRMV